MTCSSERRLTADDGPDGVGVDSGMLAVVDAGSSTGSSPKPPSGTTGPSARSVLPRLPLPRTGSCSTPAATTSSPAKRRSATPTRIPCGSSWTSRPRGRGGRRSGRCRWSPGCFSSETPRCLSNTSPTPRAGQSADTARGRFSLCRQGRWRFTCYAPSTLSRQRISSSA